MSDVENAGQGEQGAAAQQGDNGQEGASRMVDYQTYEATKNDMHKYKRQLQQFQEENNGLLEKLKQIETERQESQGNFKQLYEQKAQELDSTKQELMNVRNSIIEDKKMNAVKQAAQSMNIRPEALNDLDMVDLSALVVETSDHGRVTVHGANDFVEQLKAQRPHWFSDSTPPNINNGVGSFDPASSGEKTYSPAEMLKLEKENPSLYREIMSTKRHLLRR